jgi:ribose transport system substrate-binding protein
MNARQHEVADLLGMEEKDGGFDGVDCRGIAVVDRGAKIRLCRIETHDLAAQVVGHIGSAREFSNGGVSVAPVGVDDLAHMKREDCMKKMLLAGVALGLGIAFAAGAQAADKKTLAFVVNGASDFWKNAEAGIKKAQGELPDYNLELKYPEQATTAAQQRLMDDLVASGVAAIMVSAVDPKTETEALDRIASQIPLFTTDSDAPKTKRIAYIGSSNTAAGKQAGELALKALPDGGKCMGFVGLPSADNARERIEGVRETIKGSKVELVDIRADDVDQARAKHNVEDAMTAHPEVTCFIGFYSYNTPRIYEAVKEAGQLGKIKIVGFDEDPVTLGGVKEGSIIGTVVQQPYEWGYQGMKLMAKYVGGDKSVIPADPIIIIPTKIIDKTNVDSFWAELKQRTGAK